MDMLTIRNLKKRFADKEVLCGIDFSVPEHSVFGFVGRNVLRYEKKTGLLLRYL